MNRSLAVLVPLAALAALVTGCMSSSPPVTGGAVALVAQACAVDEITATAALDPGMALPVTDATESSAECGEAYLGASCCDSATGCIPMPYPTDICYEVAAPAASTVVEPIGTFAYASSKTTQFYDTCPTPPGEPPPPPPDCETGDSAFVLQPYPHTRYAVTLETDPATAVTTGTLYYLEEGTTAARTEDGAQLYPLLEETDGFADLTRAVETPEGTKYVDKQNDCIPRPDGCGFTCTTC